MIMGQVSLKASLVQIMCTLSAFRIKIHTYSYTCILNTPIKYKSEKMLNTIWKCYT